VNIESELRVTSDRLLQTLDQLEALENEKRSLKPDSPRFAKLAHEVERLAAEAFAQTHAQQALGERARAAEAQGVELPPIAESTLMRPLQVILAEWRDAERRLQLAEPDSAEHSAAAGDVGRLREEYHGAYKAGGHQTAGD
jgi:hypothetical protein